MHLNVSLSLGLGEENNTFEACCRPSLIMCPSLSFGVCSSSAGWGPFRPCRHGERTEEALLSGSSQESLAFCNSLC